MARRITSERSATITFVDGKFSECKFYGVCTVYTLADWEFLGSVSEKILELARQQHPQSDPA